MTELATMQLPTDELTLDRVELELSALPQVDCPVKHRFTPGLYIREILIPAGTMLTSVRHKVRHPFVITEGRIRVGSESEGWVEYVAPHHGITEAGTRRILHAVEDTVWTTYHVTDKTDIEAIAAELIDEHPNPLLPGHRGGWRRSIPTLPNA